MFLKDPELKKNELRIQSLSKFALGVQHLTNLMKKELVEIESGEIEKQDDLKPQNRMQKEVEFLKQSTGLDPAPALREK